MTIPKKALALSILGAMLATGAHAAVYISPADTALALGSEFSVRVMTTSVADLLCFQFSFAALPNILELVAIEPGDLLTQATGQWIAFPVDLGTNIERYDACVLGGHAVGSGILAYLHFRAVGVGTTPIPIALADFRDSRNGQTFPERSPGSVTVDIPLSTDRTTWGRIKGLWR